MATTPEQCARDVLDVVPMVMQAIRAEMRRRHKGELSVPQFRSLAYLRRHEGASLSEASEHIGLTLPSMSKLIDGLVAQELVVRRPCPTDRRRVTLGLTRKGRALLEQAREGAYARLGELLATLPEEDCATVSAAMSALRSAFTPPCQRSCES